MYVQRIIKSQIIETLTYTKTLSFFNRVLLTRPVLARFSRARCGWKNWSRATAACFHLDLVYGTGEFRANGWSHESGRPGRNGRDDELHLEVLPDTRWLGIFSYVLVLYYHISSFQILATKIMGIASSCRHLFPEIHCLTAMFLIWESWSSLLARLGMFPQFWTHSNLIQLFVSSQVWWVVIRYDQGSCQNSASFHRIVTRDIDRIKVWISASFSPELKTDIWYGGGLVFSILDEMALRYLSI